VTENGRGRARKQKALKASLKWSAAVRVAGHDCGAKVIMSPCSAAWQLAARLDGMEKLGNVASASS